MIHLLKPKGGVKPLAVLILSLLITAFGMRAQDSIQSTDASYAHQIAEHLRAIKDLQQHTFDQRIKDIQAKLKKDSLNAQSTHEIMSDYGIMSKIEDNTRPDPVYDGWNLYGIFATFLAIVSIIVAVITYNAQKKTEDNTKKLSFEAQRQLLNDLLRHLYRNFVITYTMRTKMKDIGYDGYPSEEHFEKMKIPLENIHLDVFYGKDREFNLMHVLYLNLRNYNEEIDAALKHITNPNIKIETKDEDFDTLEFKVSFLTNKIIETIQDIYGCSDANIEAMRKALKLSLSGDTNATGNIATENCELFTRLSLEALKGTAYSKLYNANELKDLCDTFNKDVTEERKKNERGAWKVRIIRF